MVLYSRLLLPLGAAIVALTSFLPASAQTPVGTDPMGWSKLYPDLPGGRAYYSTAWANGHPRTFSSGEWDPEDANIQFRGDFTPGDPPRCDGQGTLVMGGDAPRIYCARKPLTWCDVEVTYEVQLLSNYDPSNRSTGFLVGVRSEHQDASDSNICAGKTYYGCLRSDARAGFQVERAYHRYFSNNMPQDANGNELRIAWPGGGGIPVGVWTSVKMVAYNTSGGVRLELYRSLDHGAHWESVAAFSDLSGHLWPAAAGNSWTDQDLLNHCGSQAFGPYTQPATSVWLKFDYAKVAVRRLSVRTIQAPSSASHPTNVSLNPTSSTTPAGVAHSLTAAYADPNGANQLAEMTMRVGSDNAHALYVKYDATRNALYLLNQAGTAYLGGYAPGTNATISNGNGVLNCAATRVSTSGNVLQVLWSLTPAAGFTGNHPVFLFVRNRRGLESSFQQFGSWSVTPA